jgi:hypothetical protein
MYQIHGPLVAGAIGFIETLYRPSIGQFFRDSDFVFAILNCKPVKKAIRGLGIFKSISQALLEIHVLFKERGVYALISAHRPALPS